jgi:cytoskeleton protein RodZ
MTSIGECLRRERLRRNLQLEEVSKELKISARMLAAIEAEDFQKLPGGVFAKSFVRQYAHLLGLDEEEMAAEVGAFRPEAPSEAHKPDAAAIPLPRMEAWQSVGDDRNWHRGWSTSLPALMMVVVVMLVCSAVYAFLQRPRQIAASNSKSAAHHAQPAPQPQAAPASAPAPQPETPTGPAKQAAEVTRPEGSAPATVTTPRENETSRTAAPPASAAVPQPAPTGAPAAPGPVHVEITAIEPVWVRATTDGKYAFSGTINVNQTRTLDAHESILLRLGNAGGVTILLNGKPIGDIGPRGQVKTVQFTSGGFQIVAAPKSPAPVDPL